MTPSDSQGPASSWRFGITKLLSRPKVTQVRLIKPNRIIITRKTAGTAENPAHQQTPFHLFYDIQMVVTLLLANIYIPYGYPTTENLSDLDFDLSRSVNVKFDNAIGLAIYGFLLIVNSNIGPNSAPLRDIRL